MSKYLQQVPNCFRGIITILVLVLAGWWLYEVARRLGNVPIKDSAGNIAVDEFQRAKDILLVVLPLVTTTFGYWFGAQGREKTEARAEKTRSQLTAVVAASPDTKILANAKKNNPEEF